MSSADAADRRDSTPTVSAKNPEQAVDVLRPQLPTHGLRSKKELSVG